MTVEIISVSFSTNVWDRARIELMTPGSAVRPVSVARHDTDCAKRPGKYSDLTELMSKLIGVFPGCTAHLVGVAMH